jgi:ABC-type transport system substrate-binding protein
MAVPLLLATLGWASPWDHPEAKAQPPATGTATKPGGRLTVAIPGDFANLTPYTAGMSTADFLMELVLDKLYAPSPYVSQPEPWLAETARPNGDARTWVIPLRPGISWHDGRPFTAEDVKFTYEYYREGPINRWTHHASRTPRIEAITVEDPLTLRFACADPCAWLDRVTLADLPILPNSSFLPPNRWKFGRRSWWAATWRRSGSRSTCAPSTRPPLADCGQGEARTAASSGAPPPTPLRIRTN